MFHQVENITLAIIAMITSNNNNNNNNIIYLSYLQSYNINFLKIEL